MKWKRNKKGGFDIGFWGGDFIWALTEGLAACCKFAGEIDFLGTGRIGGSSENRLNEVC